MADRWELASTNGYGRLTAKLVAGNGSSCAYDVQIESRLPNDARTSVVSAQLVLSPPRMIELLQTLKSWLAQPLGALAVDSLQATAELAAEGPESLQISFGGKHNLVLTAGQVACRADLRHNLLEGQLAFSTDPTCLQLFVEGLESVVGASP
jgi:hypothetical protein